MLILIKRYMVRHIIFIWMTFMMFVEKSRPNNTTTKDLQASEVGLSSRDSACRDETFYSSRHHNDICTRTGL